MALIQVPGNDLRPMICESSTSDWTAYALLRVNSHDEMT